MDSGSLLEAVDLAIANKACVTGITGVSYPNGPASAGSCRDIVVELNEEQSKALLLKLGEIVRASKEED